MSTPVEIIFTPELTTLYEQATWWSEHSSRLLWEHVLSAHVFEGRLQHLLSTDPGTMAHETGEAHAPFTVDWWSANYYKTPPLMFLSAAESGAAADIKASEDRIDAALRSHFANARPVDGAWVLTTVGTLGKLWAFIDNGGGGQLVPVFPQSTLLLSSTYIDLRELLCVFDRLFSLVRMFPCPRASFLRDVVAGRLENLVVDVNSSTEVTDVFLTGMETFARLPDGRQVQLPRSAWRRALIPDQGALRRCWQCCTQDKDGDLVRHWTLCVLG